MLLGEKNPEERDSFFVYSFLANPSVIFHYLEVDNLNFTGIFSCFFLIIIINLIKDKKISLKI